MSVFFQNWQVLETELCIVFRGGTTTSMKASEVPMGERAWRSADRLDLGQRIEPIVDPMKAEELKNAGKAKIWDSIGFDVQQQALHALHKAAEKKEKLTSDDVYLEGFTPPEKKESMMGALMSEGERLGWLQDTDERRKSNRPTGRSRELHVWISRIFQKN